VTSSPEVIPGLDAPKHNTDANSLVRTGGGEGEGEGRDWRRAPWQTGGGGRVKEASSSHTSVGVAAAPWPARGGAGGGGGRGGGGVSEVSPRVLTGAVASPAKGNVAKSGSGSVLIESKWDRRDRVTDRVVPSWKGLHVDDPLPGARETMEGQMKLEQEAEKEYQALAPLAFGTGPDALTIRHLLPDIYEGWQELSVAYRHRLRFAQALGRQRLGDFREFWEQEKAELVTAELQKLERLRIHCGREMALIDAREDSWARAIEPAETIKIQGTVGAGGNTSNLTSQERLRNELKKREKDLIRCTQALTTAMTRYKAQHGKALMFRGMRYLDVMRFQRLLQEENSKQKARAAMLRRARRAL
jgi:hypothetical protein